MTRDDFQKAHGLQWAKIIGMRSFSEGMVLLSIELMENIKNLSDQQIREDASIILADLRGRLQHESALFDLPVIHEQSASGEIQTEYVDQEEEFHKQHQRTQ